MAVKDILRPAREALIAQSLLPSPPKDPAKVKQGRANRAKGARTELKLLKVLRERGYHCCRSSGSLGAYDAVAVNDLWCLWIQSKSNHGPGPAERAEMLAIPLPAGHHRLIWVWLPRGKYKVTALLDGDVQVPFAV